MVDTIDRLVNREGYTLKGARLALEGGSRRSQAPVQARRHRAPARPDIVPQLRALRNRLAAALEGRRRTFL